MGESVLIQPSITALTPASNSCVGIRGKGISSTNILTVIARRRISGPALPLIRMSSSRSLRNTYILLTINPPRSVSPSISSILLNVRYNSG